MQQPVVNERGERVIPASRRPDGTIRKERRIRAGYVPQEEQEIYQSVGAQFRQGVPSCPGLDENEVEALKTAAKTKAQKKNEKRKAKRQEEKPGTDGITSAMQAASLNEAAASSQAAPADDADLDPKSALEKQIRALKKKLRQCEALVERKDAGQELTAPEKEKLSKMPGWEQEAARLESQLQALG